MSTSILHNFKLKFNLCRKKKRTYYVEDILKKHFKRFSRLWIYLTLLFRLFVSKIWVKLVDEEYKCYQFLEDLFAMVGPFPLQIPY